MVYDPVLLSKSIQRLVISGSQRKYYRFRGGRWYGGIATADCVGCNLRCVFCWGSYARDNPARKGRFYTPSQVFRRLDKIARKRRYRFLRISGNEPTISRDHLLSLLEFIEYTNYTFILETNGILIGYDKTYAKALSKFRNLHVRVSIKGATPEEFSKLTGAIPEAFELQLQSLRNLLDYGVSVHPAVMLSFSSRKGIDYLVTRLNDVDREMVEELEEEYVFLYPHVVEQLRKAGIWPKKAFEPDNIPGEYI